ncbi:MAG: flagellar hook-basal body complex protein FliE [Clostridiales bacterium]|nr:flagellar hook-basal body complex protein FliE [Clostridiales bacterium]
MEFTPIQSIDKISSLEQLNGVTGKLDDGNKAEIPFQSLFTDAIQNVKDTDAAKNAAIYDLATGNTDSIHDVMIASTKATLSVDLLVNLRNKALEAYNEITNMQV